MPCVWLGRPLQPPSSHVLLLSRRARQLAAQEDGASRDASSRASQRVEDEVRFPGCLAAARWVPAGCCC